MNPQTGGELSVKQQAFVLEYLRNGFNATKAYTAAGYVAKNDNVAASSASALLRVPKIASAVAEATREVIAPLATETALTVQRVVEGLLREATDYGEGSSQAARVSAWSWLGKHLAMFIDRKEVTSKRMRVRTIETIRERRIYVEAHTES